jgi:hypothetical protein
MDTDDTATPDIEAANPAPAETAAETPQESWPLPTGTSIPKPLTLPPIPGVRDHKERVTFRDPTTLKAGDRKTVIRAITSAGAAGAAVDITDGVLCMVIDHWTFLLPLPRLTPDSLDLLEIADYDLLTEVVGPVSDLLFPRPGAPDPQPPSNG